ncbi:hypothetical protein CLOAM1485 [Candidatus Cloacimonas acidaminovorans str. Evry]|uniref:Uncharacterized protein n=1 Tax=Cloacimonas acidaminovorans (strain Evry) TaxID=459349 RepID=B0VFJ7_CLOAI|nr:hypothetical protein CLOAM1485 [Candidatus Cloacimonas acidaminovorans str. Evry]
MLILTNTRIYHIITFDIVDYLTTLKHFPNTAVVPLDDLYI